MARLGLTLTVLILAVMFLASGVMEVNAARSRARKAQRRAETETDVHSESRCHSKTGRGPLFTSGPDECKDASSGDDLDEYEDAISGDDLDEYQDAISGDETENSHKCDTKTRGGGGSSGMPPDSATSADETEKDESDTETDKENDESRARSDALTRKRRRRRHVTPSPPRRSTTFTNHGRGNQIARNATSPWEPIGFREAFNNAINDLRRNSDRRVQRTTEMLELHTVYYEWYQREISSIHSSFSSGEISYNQLMRREVLAYLRLQSSIISSRLRMLVAQTSDTAAMELAHWRLWVNTGYLRPPEYDVIIARGHRAEQQLIQQAVRFRATMQMAVNVSLRNRASSTSLSVMPSVFEEMLNTYIDMERYLSFRYCIRNLDHGIHHRILRLLEELFTHPEDYCSSTVVEQHVCRYGPSLGAGMGNQQQTEDVCTPPQFT